MEPLKILIVEDDGALANIIKFKLTQEAPHFSIAVVESGQECLEYLKKNEADCILSDYQMPGMSGLELLQNLRSQNSDVPFIFITGQGNESVARDAFKSGADDYFTKDWGFAHFARIINSVDNAVKHREVERSHSMCEEALRESEARYRAFVANCSEAIWRFELDPSVPVSLPGDEQTERIFQQAYVAESNDAGARIIGLMRGEEAIGKRLREICPPADPRNIEHVRRFVQSGYRLVKDEVFPRDVHGVVKHVRSTFIGVVEDGFLVRAWGVSAEMG